jgi:glutathione S-transferase
LTYTLYARPASGSAAVEALLQLLDVQHEVVDVPREADGSIPASFRAINPMGQVPVLKLPDGTIMTESAAIMIYLADLVPGLAPAPASPERAKYLRAIIFMAATPYNTDLRLYYPDRYSTDESHAPAIAAKASQDLTREFAVFESWLGDGPFIAGKTMSAADIYAAMLLSWSDDVPGLLARHPKLKALYDAVASQNTVRPVWERNAFPCLP